MILKSSHKGLSCKRMKLCYLSKKERFRRYESFDRGKKVFQRTTLLCLQRVCPLWQNNNIWYEDKRWNNTLSPLTYLLLLLVILWKSRPLQNFTSLGGDSAVWSTGAVTRIDSTLSSKPIMNDKCFPWNTKNWKLVWVDFIFLISHFTWHHYTKLQRGKNYMEWNPDMFLLLFKWK